MGFLKKVGNVATGGLTSDDGGPLGRMFSGPQAVQLSPDDQARFTDPNLPANQAKIGNMIGSVQSQPLTTINTAPQDQFRTQQTGLANTLMGQVNGTGGPSVAEQQLRLGQEGNIQSQMAQAAGARGVSAGLTQRNLARNLASGAQDTNAQAGLLRAQEQQAATANLGSLLSGARGQDQALATNQAQLTTQQQAQHDDLVQKYMAMGLSLDQAQFQAQQALANANLGVQSGNVTRQTQSDAGLLGAVGSIAGSAISK